MKQHSCIVAIVVTCLCLWQCAVAHPFAPRAPYRLATVRVPGLTEGPDLVSRCSEKWHNTTLDHYTWVSTVQDCCVLWQSIRVTSEIKRHLQARHSAEEAEHATRRYMQRYFVCDEYWMPDGPIFFYLGNEADVLLCETCPWSRFA